MRGRYIHFTLGFDVEQYALHYHFHGNFRLVTELSTSLNELYSDIHHFWEIEEPTVSVSYTLTEDALVEEHFVSTIMRLASGRFQVRLPFKPGTEGALGTSWRAPYFNFCH